MLAADGQRMNIMRTFNSTPMVGHDPAPEDHFDVNTSITYQYIEFANDVRQSTRFHESSIVKPLAQPAQMASTFKVFRCMADGVEKIVGPRCNIVRLSRSSAATEPRDNLPQREARRKMQGGQEHLPIPAVEMGQLFGIWNDQLKPTIGAGFKQVFPDQTVNGLADRRDARTMAVRNRSDLHACACHKLSSEKLALERSVQTLLCERIRRHALTDVLKPPDLVASGASRLRSIVQDVDRQ